MDRLDLTGDREVVLPSGRFARMRPITVRDLSQAWDKSAYMCVVRLAAMTVTIDDRAYTVDELLDMNAAEFMPIQEMVTDYASAMMKRSKGVA